MLTWVDGPTPYYRWSVLADAGVTHGVFTREGGVSEGPWTSLNVGATVGDDPAHVSTNLARLHAALGIAPGQVVSGRQVHGDRVAVVRAEDGGRVLDATDALVSDVADRYLLLRLADCVPVLLYSEAPRAVGLAHAGWRGTVSGIAAKTVAMMVAAYGCRPAEMRALIGPSIAPCCYEVGAEVVAAVAQALGHVDALIVPSSAGAGPHLDLWQANALQLRQAGLRQVEIAGLCTACHVDRFFSHRAERGHTGRFAVVIGLDG